MTFAKTIVLVTALILASFASHAQEAKPAERWPWYGEWERSRFESLSPFVQSLIKRDEAEAIHLIENGTSLTEMVSSHEISRMAEPKVKIAYMGREPEMNYPVAILAAVADLPGVIAAMGKCSPATLIATDPKGNTALAWASHSGHADVVKILLDHGDDPLRRDTDNNTPLSLAVMKKQAEVVRHLIAAIPRQKYVQVGIVDQVWMASYFGDTPTLRALLDAGVPPSYVAPQGNTALISAVGDANLERVRLLLDHGATVDGHRYRGQSIFEIAETKLKRDSDDAHEIHRLINAAPRRDSGWKKSIETERMEDLMRMVNPRPN